MGTGFSRFVKHHRKERHWSLAELARRGGLTQPEVSRLETNKRTPTLRHVRGLAEAFSAAPTSKPNDPSHYKDWLSILVDLGERARINARSERSA